ncbi:MAG: hypothetical protein IJC80_00705 [Clostridia bacterium]|nr:hypothetical protein [Clostridia bacterium]
MKKIDPIVLKETGFVALISFIMCVFMNAVFLIVDYFVDGAWSWLVLLGTVIGYVAAVGNFFLMGLTVVKALGKEGKDAANLIKLSQMGRLLVLFLIALGAYLIDLFAFEEFSVGFIIAVVIPYTFPRIGVMLRPLASKIKQRRNKG